MKDLTMSKKPAHSNLFAALLIVIYIATASMGLLSTPNLIHAEETKSLYDRLGGIDPITAVVDEFVNRLVADPRVKGRFASTDVKRFKMLNTELVCQSTGGPCKYSGRAMKDTHNGMRISQAEFDLTAGHLASTLKKFKVPKQESKELMAIIGSLRKDIVEGS
jgi:hemoglobin